MYQFTSESVSQGHPDKIADLISDAVATYLIDGKDNHRAAVETLVTTNMVTLAGEYKSDKFDKVYIEKLVRAIVRDIGYEQEGFHWDKLKVYNELHGQSPDIALGTDNFGTPLTELITAKRKVGAQSNTTATDIYEDDPGIYTSIYGGNAGDVRFAEDASEGLGVEDGSRRAYFSRIHWLSS